MPSARNRSSSRPAPSSPSSSSGSTSSSSSGSESDDEQAAVAALRKRKRRSNKTSRSAKKPKGDKFEPYRRFAAWYMRTQDAFVNFYGVFDFGIRYENKKFGKLTPEKFFEKHCKDLDIFFTIHTSISSFDDLLIKLKAKPARGNNLAKLMNDTAGQARGNDIKSLLDRGLVYIGLDLPEKELTPTINAALSKEQSRGHHHVVLSRLLCPIRLLNEFDQSRDEYRKKILRGNIKFSDEDFPAMLYPQPEGHDPEDIEYNLFRNQTAVRYFKHLFTSPSSAMREPGTKPKLRTGQAKLNGMSEVTPGSIAYAYLMFWFNISAFGDWRNDDDLTDRVKYYEMVLALFEEDDDDGPGLIDWRKDTLDWWNFQVFGTVPEKSADESDDQPRATTLQLLRQQQAMKAASAAAAETEAKAAAEAEAAAAAAAKAELAAAAASTSDASTSTPSNTHTDSSTTSVPDNATSNPQSARAATPSFSTRECVVPPGIPPIATPPPSSPCTNANELFSSPRQPLSPANHQNADANQHKSPPHLSKLSRKLEKKAAEREKKLAEREKRAGSSDRRR